VPNRARSGSQPESYPPLFAAGPLRSERRRSRVNSSSTAGCTLVDATTYCIYTWRVAFAWSQSKRAATLKAHGLDFVDAPRVFDGATTYTVEGDRFSYGEQRSVTLGLLAGVPVSVVHRENEHAIRIISFRKATHREALIIFNEIQH